MSTPVVHELFASGELGISCYRIPLLVSLPPVGGKSQQAAKPTVLAFAEAREHSCGDIGPKRIAFRRSDDAGHSWSATQFLYNDTDTPAAQHRGLNLGSVTAMADRNTVVLHWGECVHLQNCTASVMQMRSSDGGLSWEPPAPVAGIVDAEANVSAFKLGEGAGLQLASAAAAARGAAGRLVVCGRFNSDRCGQGSAKGAANCGARCMLSDDGAATWRLGTGDVPAQKGGVSPSECQAVELLNGSLVLNARDESRSGFRVVVRSDDFGETWTAPRLATDLPDATCQGSTIGAVTAASPAPPQQQQQTLFFSNAHDQSARQNLTLSTSTDGGATWRVAADLAAGQAQYSALAYVRSAPGAVTDAAPECLVFAYEEAHAAINVGRCCEKCGLSAGAGGGTSA
jgi:sialidase-1